METGTTQQRGGGRRGKSADQRGGSNVGRRSTTTRRAGWKTKLITRIVAISAFLGAAGPVTADTLVSNFTQLALGGERLSDSDLAMSFTTGTNASGYQFESVAIGFSAGRGYQYDPVYVSLNADSGNGRPDTSGRGQIAMLANANGGVTFEGPVTPVTKYIVTGST